MELFSFLSFFLNFFLNSHISSYATNFFLSKLLLQFVLFSTNTPLFIDNIPVNSDVRPDTVNQDPEDDISDEDEENKESVGKKCRCQQS